MKSVIRDHIVLEPTAVEVRGILSRHGPFH